MTIDDLLMSLRSTVFMAAFKYKTEEFIPYSFDIRNSSFQKAGTILGTNYIFLSNMKII